MHNIYREPSSLVWALASSRMECEGVRFGMVGGCGKTSPCFSYWPWKYPGPFSAEPTLTTSSRHWVIWAANTLCSICLQYVGLPFPHQVGPQGCQVVASVFLRCFRPGDWMWPSVPLQTCVVPRRTPPVCRQGHPLCPETLCLHLPCAAFVNL
jgi:hypothetical protein